MTSDDRHDLPTRRAPCDADTAARQRRARLASLPDAELLRLTALALRLAGDPDPDAPLPFDGETLRARAEARMAADRQCRQDRQRQLRLAVVLAAGLMAATLILWLVWS
jgi:hypothetical protein